MIKGFRDFILRGNVVDLAVAVIIGTAFGAVVTSLTKLIIAAVIYFFVVVPLNYLLARVKGPVVATTKTCPECLSDVPIAAHRCKFCAQPLSA
jgi:large conductance mechanosensitive channel